MTDISTTAWSEVDGSNNQFPPEGWPAGMFPNAVEPTARMMMAAVKRSWDRENPVYAATQSTADSYVITPTQAITGYGLYEVWRVRMPIANASTSPQMLISSLPPQNIRKIIGSSVTALASGDIRAKDHTFYWDGAQHILTDPFGTQGVTSIAVASDTTQGVLVSGSPITGVGVIGVSLDPTRVPAKASPTSSDIVLVGDQAAAGVPKSVLMSLLLTGTAPGLVAAKASPTSSDIVLIGDAAAGFIAKGATIAQVRSAMTGLTTPGTAVVMNPYVSNTGATVLHGLGAVPTGCEVVFKCISAEGGYTSSDTIVLSGAAIDSAANAAFAIFADAALFGVSTTNDTPRLVNKATHASFVSTAAKWSLTITPLLRS